MTLLLPEHIKPRLLGHWGTSPGLNSLAHTFGAAFDNPGLVVACI